MDLHSLVAPPAPERGSALAELARIVERFSPIDGEHRTAIEPLTFHRYSAPSAGEYTFSKVALIFAAQGAKQITAGDQSYRYDTAHWEGDLKSGSGRLSTPQSGLFENYALVFVAGVLAIFGYYWMR